MATFQPKTRREKIIFAITLSVTVLAVLYYAFFAGLIESYQKSNDDLKKARETYETAKKRVKGSERINREYDEIAKKMPKAPKGKRPEMVLTEEIAALCRTINIPAPDIMPTASKKIDDAPGYSYLILPVEKISAPLPLLVELLQQLSARSYIIRKLTITGATPGRGDEMSMSVDIAEIMRTEDLTSSDQETEETDEGSSKIPAGEIKESNEDEEEEEF